MGIADRKTATSNAHMYLQIKYYSIQFMVQ